MNFEKRLRRIEAGAGYAEVFFVLAGQRAGIPRKQILAACNEAVSGVHSRRASVLLNAERASDGSQLHVLAQAIAAGPVPHGMVN
jgi:hypothetical protein